MPLRFPSIATWPTKTRDLRKSGKSRMIRKSKRMSMSNAGVSRRSSRGRRTY